GGEEQPGNQTQESGLRSAEQDARAEESAADAGEKEEGGAGGGGWGGRVAIRDGAGDGAGKKRGGVGGVGRDGRHAGEKQRGEENETAPTGDRVEQSGDERREKEEERMRKVHGEE